VGIEGWYPSQQWESIVIHISMGALRLGVDTRIRSSGTMDHDPAVTQIRKGPLKMILYRVACCLTLPSFEGASMIGDFEFESHDTESSQP
jgi:hypothetical protein